MSEITFAIPNALVLEKIVSIITDMDLNDKDTMGDVYEELLSQTNSAGKMGAFRTPRHIEFNFSKKQSRIIRFIG